MRPTRANSGKVDSFAISGSIQPRIFKTLKPSAARSEAGTAHPAISQFHHRQGLDSYISVNPHIRSRKNRLYQASLSARRRT
jgi:hypothetical protein